MRKLDTRKGKVKRKKNNYKILMIIIKINKPEKSLALDPTANSKKKFGNLLIRL